MGRRLGLLIGINQYQDSSFRPLRYAETDARAIAHWLVNSRGGRWSSSDVQLLLGAQATRQSIEQWLAQLCLQAAGPDDTLFLYFAGHAFLDEGRAEGYLALADTFYQQPASGLQLATTLLQLLGRSPARAIICVLDCFQTGRFWGQRRASPFDCKPLPGPMFLTALQQLPNRFLLCSCRGNEFAPEQGEQNVGMLAHRLLLGLCGGAADPTNGQIIFQRLALYLQQSLGEQQRPQLFGQGLGPVVLVGEEETGAPATAMARAGAGAGGETGQPGLFQRPGGPGPVLQAAYQMGQVVQPTQTPAGIAQLSPLQPSSAMAMPRTEQQAALLLQQARALLQQQKPAEALGHLEQALQLMPTNTEALLLKGQLLGTAGRFAEAMQVVEQVLGQEPSNALAWSMRAALLANLGQFEEALRAVERSLSLDPHNAETQTIKSAILVKMAVAQTPAAPTGAPLPGASPSAASSSAGASATAGASVGSGRGPRRRGRALLISLALQVAGLGLGLLGAWLAIKHPGAPGVLPLTIEGLGLALLCANALSGCYFDGFWRFLPIPLVSLLAMALPAYLLLTQSGRARLAALVEANPRGFTAIQFALLWFGLVAILPFLLALLGLLSGWLGGARRR
ncbi:MAG: tetratricopeptide repeat protein [Thermogemmatispora sp.]|uniref:caspase family protein n=1 Tax=Thermogemmatispora sp. TaxID=1968838 RepID=UPI0019FA49E4|nr:tetratricopeptide repeat protein [Thermogemmatispora sp.]MBE3564303.1 tetratricopeptide repeat protein [Thermogemmatispora sp.]